MKKSSFCLLLGFSLPFFLALSPGDSAPEFQAKNQSGKLVRLSDFKGKPLLVYFYPKDETPGCTKEACNFRDDYAKFKKLGAAVLGVSAQDEKSHQEFKQHHHLPFDLLVDTDGKLAQSFGVGNLTGTDLRRRESILIDPDGKVAKFYPNVDPKVHSQEVLKDLEAMQKKG